jgi:hypothetical protein
MAMASTPRRGGVGTLAVLGLVGLVAGCGMAGGEQSGEAAERGGTPAARQQPTRPPAKFSAAQLSKALLTSFNALTPTDDPDTGVYGALPVTQVSLDPRDIPPGVTFSPDKCRAAIWNGPDRRQFNQSPTAFVQLADSGAVKSGRQSVLAWDILIATSGQPANAILGTPVPGCRKVKVTYRGKSMLYQEKEPPRLSTPSRAAFLTPSESRARKAWLVTYTGNGYAGMVVLEGPATQAQVMAFATRASQRARQTLG